MMRKIFFMVLSMVVMGCTSHSTEKNSATAHSVVIMKKPLTTFFYYTGVIQPFNAMLISAPADGTIDSVAFHYGEQVHKGQSLFTVFSEKFQTDYKASLMQYVKAKTEFTNAKGQLLQNEFLHKNQLISEDDFNMKKSAFYTAQLNFVDAKEALTALLKQLNVPDLNPYQLSIENIDTITRALHLTNGRQKLHVVAPESGTILLGIVPDAEVKMKKIAEGLQIKQGDVLAMVCDVNSLSIHINVDEFTINQIKKGQNVKVTGAAFPQFTLQGRIAEVEHQGQVDRGSVPLFAVVVVVPHLTAAEQQVIQIGMTAKVEIENQSPPVILAPLQAISEKKGMTYVTIQSVGSQKVKEVPVTTGATTADSVVIEGALHEGDKIVYAAE